MGGINNRTLASPNTIVTSYFNFARRTLLELDETEAQEERASKIAVAIIMLVGAVEAYLNIVGRMWVEQNPTFTGAQQIIDDLDSRRAFGTKLKTWPMLLFGKPLELGKGVGQEFLKFVETRNTLLHFTTTYDTFQHENITIRGLADITVYDSLNRDHLERTLTTAESTIAALIELQRLSKVQTLISTTFWTARPYTAEELDQARVADEGQ